MKFSFPRTFWIANTIELFERWAWYGMFMVFALYLTGSTDEGALGFSQSEKGYIMGPLVGLLYFLPVITGALADRFGYKRMLIIAFVILSSGYFLLAFVNSFWTVFMSFLYVAIGAALFKPVISATIAKTTNSNNSGLGFGIFYMIVNVGAFIGPIFASKLRALEWTYVFYCSSAVIFIGLLLVLFFYREPVKEQNHLSFGKAIRQSLRNIAFVLGNIRFLILLLLIAGFWSMYNQLFYSLPVYIEQWHDTTSLYKFIENLSPALARAIGTADGRIEPEMITNIDAFYIMIFQVFVSMMVMRMKHVSAMVSGILISAIGIGLTFATNNTFYLFLTILIFGMGEMICSPKIQEYIGHAAPPDKVAVYMGASFLPLAGGNFAAGFLSGDVYQQMSDKYGLLKNDLMAAQHKVPDFSEQFTKNDLWKLGMEKMQMSGSELQQYLWETHHPDNIWLVYTGIGLGTAVLLFIYDRLVLRKARHL